VFNVAFAALMAVYTKILMGEDLISMEKEGEPGQGHFIMRTLVHVLPIVSNDLLFVSFVSRSGPSSDLNLEDIQSDLHT
jgi:hypothetical protein